MKIGAFFGVCDLKHLLWSAAFIAGVIAVVRMTLWTAAGR